MPGDEEKRRPTMPGTGLTHLRPPKRGSALPCLTAWRRSSHGGSSWRGAFLVADLVAVEEKPWWRWAWDAGTSLGLHSSHYVVHWPAYLLVIRAALVLVGFARRRRRQPTAMEVVARGCSSFSAWMTQSKSVGEGRHVRWACRR